MKKKSLSLLVGLLSVAPVALAKEKASFEAPYVPGEVLVKLKEGKSLLGLKSVDKQLDLVAGRFAVVKSEQKSMALALAELRQHPAVEYAEPNYIFTTSTQISPVESLLAKRDMGRDERFGLLWGLHNTGRSEPNRDGSAPSADQGTVGVDVNALRAWEITRGSRDIVIAVIDTGIDYRHTDLRENLWVNAGEIPGNGIDDDGNGYIDDVYGWNAAADNGNPMDGNGHGTHCAGTIGAVHGNGGIAGVMGDVKMMAVKFLTDSGSGTLVDAIEAIDYATKMNVDIMSNSWGGGGFTQALFDSIKAASDRGIIFVAAAGNSSSNNDTRPNYPSNYATENMVAVAANTHKDQLASFSSFGKRTVHVSAPGHNVLSTTPNNTFSVYSGTSMATPHVSGVLGLYLAQEGRRPHAEMVERLNATSVPASAYRRTTISGGRADAYNLLTNTRPERDEPNPDLWVTERLEQAFESDHPYANNARLSRRITVAGARYIRVVVERYDLETNYDFLTLKDATGATVERLSGRGENVTTDYVSGDTFTLEFTSDSSQVAWGFVVREIQVIR